MIYLVAGTRPNLMKVAPVRRELERRGLLSRLVHTGQQVDPALNTELFVDLGMDPPEHRLEVTGRSHAETTASILLGVERDLLHQRPKLVVVFGDVTSTLSAALAAAKLGIPVAHVEAGLRSRDWTMPEEINRVLTDQLSDLLLTPSRDADRVLLDLGVPQGRIRFVGNVMIDSLVEALRRPRDVLARWGLQPQRYALATLHRPANVDSAPALERVCEVLAAAAGELPVLFPAHPRTLARAAEFGLRSRLDGIDGLRLVHPLSYGECVTLMARSKLVLTDSGGIQEETTALGVPCLTLREGTERPVTVTEGTNTIVGLERSRVLEEVRAILDGRGKRGRVPEGWDGQAAPRIVDALELFLQGTPAPRTAGPRA